MAQVRKSKLLKTMSRKPLNPHERKDVQVSGYVNRGRAARLRAIAYEQDLTLSKLIARVLDEYVTNIDNPTPSPVTPDKTPNPEPVEPIDYDDHDEPPYYGETGDDEDEDDFYEDDDDGLF